nr:MAG TPA: hypothetical protein [Siphoviridae sp. cttZS1]
MDSGEIKERRRFGQIGRSVFCLLGGKVASSQARWERVESEKKGGARA